MKQFFIAYVYCRENLLQTFKNLKIMKKLNENITIEEINAIIADGKCPKVMQGVMKLININFF